MRQSRRKAFFSRRGPTPVRPKGFHRENRRSRWTWWHLVRRHSRIQGQTEKKYGLWCCSRTSRIGSGFMHVCLFTCNTRVKRKCNGDKKVLSMFCFYTLSFVFSLSCSHIINTISQRLYLWNTETGLTISYSYNSVSASQLGWFWFKDVLIQVAMNYITLIVKLNEIKLWIYLVIWSSGSTTCKETANSRQHALLGWLNILQTKGVTLSTNPSTKEKKLTVWCVSYNIC